MIAWTFARFSGEGVIAPASGAKREAISFESMGIASSPLASRNDKFFALATTTALFAALFLGPYSHASETEVPARTIPKAETRYVTVGKVGPLVVTKGKASEIVLPVSVMTGHHIQSNPASNPQLIPTRLELVGPSGVVIGEAIYPPGKPYRLQGSSSEITTYHGEFVIKVPVTATAKARTGEARIAGKLRYQACNDKICFFPQAAMVSIPIQLQ